MPMRRTSLGAIAAPTSEPSPPKAGDDADRGRAEPELSRWLSSVEEETGDIVAHHDVAVSGAMRPA